MRHCEIIRQLFGIIESQQVRYCLHHEDLKGDGIVFPKLLVKNRKKPDKFLLPHIHTDLGSCGLLTVVLQLLLISDLEHGFESKSRASGSIISLGMSPFSVFPQVRDHRFEGATIPGAITLAQRPKELR